MMSLCWQQQSGFVLGLPVYYIQQGCYREITATTLLCQHDRCDALESLTGWLLCSPFVCTTNSTSAKTHTSRVSMVLLGFSSGFCLWGIRLLGSRLAPKRRHVCAAAHMQLVIRALSHPLLQVAGHACVYPRAVLSAVRRLGLILGFGQQALRQTGQAQCATSFCAAGCACVVTPTRPAFSGCLCCWGYASWVLGLGRYCVAPARGRAQQASAACVPCSCELCLFLSAANSTKALGCSACFC